MTRRQRRHWVFLGDLEEHCVREVCRGAAEYVAARPDVTLDPCPVHPGRGRRPTLAHLRRADGLILDENDLHLLEGGARFRQPHVYYLANSRHRRIPAVRLDERAIGRMAAEHLRQRGYRHLAFFGDPKMPWAKQRGEGFRDGAEAHGLEIRTHHALPSEMAVYRSPWLQSRHRGLPAALASLPKPCGIFAAHDVAACYIIQAALDLGIPVPDHLGVIGADEDPIANAAAGLAISSVQIPFREVGWHAAALLEARTRGRRPPDPPPLPPVGVAARTSTHAFMVPDPLVRRAQEMIEKHRAEGPSVGEVVSALRTTRVTLGRRFREHLGTTVTEYIQSRRIGYAEELLRRGELTVAEAAEACHFHDCSYFCQVFKRATGRSPGSLLPRR